ncbi:transcription factor bHLH51-like [Chenopodium quinoa]|uniref:BHLH domain-containing protein n=1 Tax=Chenopodium quinoa TaxID=63459 RepID=A0A803M3W1_CHEQI|nr:transcription factor bHLH51-like [Chenopodium quinoa]
MAQNSFSYPRLPEEETMGHHFHATTATRSMQLLQELPTNYGFEFEGIAELEDKTAANSSHSHRQAEKRRRDRINGQLARLRRLVPKSEKMDKAALLERVVEQVKELKRKASEISKLFTIPTEIDDITIECHTNNMQGGIPTFARDQKENHPNNKNIMFMKATLCCEDRPDLIPELIRALKDLNLTIIGAEIGCLGGRMKSILLLYYKIDNNDGVCNVSAIKQSLMGVLTRIISWSSASTSNFRVTSKRQRFFFSS